MQLGNLVFRKIEETEVFKVGQTLGEFEQLVLFQNELDEAVARVTYGFW